LSHAFSRKYGCDMEFEFEVTGDKLMLHNAFTNKSLMFGSKKLFGG